MAAFDSVDECFCGHFSHLFDGDVDRGEHGGQILGRINIIDTDNGDILRYLKSVLLYGTHGSNRGHIVRTEPGCGIAVSVEQDIGSLVSSFGGELYIADISL